MGSSTINLKKDNKIIVNALVCMVPTSYGMLHVIRQYIDAYNKCASKYEDAAVAFCETFRLADIRDLKNREFELEFKYKSVEEMSKIYHCKEMKEINKSGFSPLKPFITIASEDSEKTDNLNAMFMGSNIIIDFDRCTIKQVDFHKTEIASTVDITQYPLCPYDINNIKFNDLEDFMNFLDDKKVDFFRVDFDNKNIYRNPKTIVCQ